ncbi:MAG: malate dehydrogenase [Candidatus Eremiobacterota bacterium]
MARKKITVVGAGFVGSTTAQRLAERNYADLVLVDIVEGMPQGKALDLMQAGPVCGYDCQIVGTNGYEETANSDLVVITSGLPRKPGMSRDDLLFKNMEIVSGVTKEIASRSPDCQILVVSNPLDAMTQLAQEVSKFPAQRVYGMAGVLDTARFRAFLAMELKVSVENVEAYVLGGHGDTMVPVVGYTNVAGVPISQLISQERIAEIVTRTQNGGAEIVSLLKTGSAYYAPSAAVVEMVDAVMFDKKKILPVCARLSGQYGIDGLYVGVPCKMGAAGVEQIMEIQLNDEEKAALSKSAEAVRELVDKLKTRM